MEGADAVLRRVHEAGYRFPPEFAGFQAAFLTGDGDRGTVIVRGQRSVELDVEGPVAAPATVDWVRDAIASIVGHRWPSPYDEGDGRYDKKIEGDTVSLLDDPFSSSYRIGPAGANEVHRTAGPNRFSIVVSERCQLPDGRYLPTHFTVFFWSVESGRLVRAEHFRDTYVAVDGVYLPSRREVTSAADDGLSSRSLDLTHHAVTRSPEAARA